jgi:hypothetical protein
MVNASGKPRSNRRDPGGGKRRTPSPSRLRYDAKNPVLSLRLTADLRAALDELRYKGDFSFSDIFRVGLELLSPTVGDSYSNGVMFALAELYLITCDECQDTIMEFFDQYQKSR